MLYFVFTSKFYRCGMLLPLQTVYTEHVHVVFVLAVILLTLRMYITCPVVQILLFLSKEKPRSPSLLCGRNRNKIVCIASPCRFLVFLLNSIQRAWLIAPNFAQCDCTIRFENCTFTGGVLFGVRTKHFSVLEIWLLRNVLFVLRQKVKYFYQDLWMYVLLFTLAISNGNLCCNIHFISLLFRVSEVGALPLTVLVTGVWRDNWFFGDFQSIWETHLIGIITSRWLTFRR
jgi:hypothetical protein